MLKLLEIRPSHVKGKRLTAIFSNGKHTITTHFGLDSGSTYIDHHDEKKRLAYIARHQVNEDWSDPTRAGTLSRYILWEKPTLFQAIKSYKSRFII